MREYEMSIKQENSHYVLYVDHIFEGRYDTWSEAVNAYDDILRERNTVSA